MDYGNGFDNYQTTHNDGGGGFTDHGDGGGGFNSSPSGQRRATTNTLRPVTVKQLVDATQDHPDSEFKVEGTELSIVTFVAVVRNIAIQSTNATFRVEDGTGMIDVKQWLDQDKSALNERGGSNVEMEKYVRVTGILKAFNNKRHVLANHIRPILDPNEIMYHLLEATAVTLYFTRGPAQAKNGVNNAVNDHGGDGEWSSLDPFQLQLAKFVSEYSKGDSSLGIHKNVIQQQLGRQGNVESAIDYLIENGLAYNTIDEDHVGGLLKIH